MNYLYRYFDYASYSPEKSIYYEKYPIEKVTPKGNWIRYHGRKRFVRTGTGKCLAHPTLKEAFESFKYRKAYQLRRLEAQYSFVKRLTAALPTIDHEKLPEIHQYLYFE